MSEGLRQRLDVDLLGDLYRIIDLDADIANGALDLRLSPSVYGRSTRTGDHVAATQLAVDRKVEQREVSRAPLHL